VLFGLFDMSGNYMRLVLFPVGGLLAELTPLLTHSPRFRRWCALGALPGLFLILEVPGFYSSTLGLALFITAWIFSPRMALRSQLLAELGNLSYAVFLTHGLVLRPVRWAGPTDGSLIDLMSMLLASLSLIGVVALGFRTLVLDRLQESLPAHPSFARS